MVPLLLEVLGGSWGPASIRSFLQLAEDLAAAGDKARTLQALNLLSLRVHSGNADDWMPASVKIIRVAGASAAPWASRRASSSSSMTVPNW
jgi:hypothetical protein